MEKNDKIVCTDIWKVFGPNEKNVLSNLDKTLSRSEVQEKTGHVVAVKDVTFSVQKGETFVVMGLSGSGKSTLVRCLSRLIEPTAGQVSIDGQDVTTMSNRDLTELRRNRMSMVFQHFGLFPHRRVIENIGYGLEIRGVKKKDRLEKSMETLNLVGLDGWDQHYPRELSGGMQQRVGLARALAADPEILLMDEPFSALDPLIRRQLQKEFIKLSKKLKKTTVFDYFIPEQNGLASANLNTYLQFSHLTSLPPGAIGTNRRDFHFGECQLIGAGSPTNNNLFNLYWLPYYSELYNPDTRIMTVSYTHLTLPTKA